MPWSLYHRVRRPRAAFGHGAVEVFRAPRSHRVLDACERTLSGGISQMPAHERAQASAKFKENGVRWLVHGEHDMAFRTWHVVLVIAGCECVSVRRVLLRDNKAITETCYLCLYVVAACQWLSTAFTHRGNHWRLKFGVWVPFRNSYFV